MYGSIVSHGEDHYNRDAIYETTAAIYETTAAIYETAGTAIEEKKCMDRWPKVTSIDNTEGDLN